MIHPVISTVLAEVSAKLDPSGLLGSSVTERLVNGLFFYTLLGCLAGLLISVLIWVFSSRAQNYHHAATGRQGTIIAAGGPTTDEQPHTPTRGERVELARYSSDTGQRLLIGQRIDGIVHVFDEPLADDGPSFIVETHLETNSELQALVADYLAKAKRLGYAPMHGWY